MEHETDNERIAAGAERDAADGPAGDALDRLAREAGALALSASQRLRQALDEDGDTKKARELSGIVKDMAALAQSLRGQEPRTLTVCFAPDAADAAE